MNSKSKRKGPMSLVEGAKISGGNVYTWPEVAGLSVTDNTATDTMHILGLSDRSAIGVINKTKWNGLLHRRSRCY